MHAPINPDSIGIGIIGTGAFARSGQIPAFQRVPGVKVLAVCNTRVDAAEATAREFSIQHVFSDYHEMLRLEGLNLVTVVTPPALHYPMVMAALEAGKHVLCEKPMAMNIDEAASMYRTAQACGVIHCIDHELRFNPTRRKIKLLIDDGYIGALRHVTVPVSASFNATAGSRLWGWWMQRSMGGGILGANGSHYIDMLRWYFGEIRAVSGQLCTTVPLRPVPSTGEMRHVETDDLCIFLCEFELAGQGTVILSTVDVHQQGHRLEVFGEDGTLVIDSQGRLWGGRKGEPALSDMSEPDPAAEMSGITRNLFPQSFVHFAEALVDAVRTGRPNAFATSFYDGMKCQQVMDAVTRSWQERRWVTVEEIRPKA